METQEFTHCSRLAQTHYENFPVGSRFVSSKIRPDIHAIYAFARTADDFADEAEYEGTRLEKLSAWRTLLYEAAAGNPTGPVFTALAQTIRRHDLPVLWLDHLIQAFEQDVKQSRHPNFASIVDYATRSANPVGRLVLWVHGYRDEEHFRLSDRICSALQFTNFWQDVAVDWKKNRVYLPQDDMQKFGYTEADLASAVCDKRFQDLLALQMDRTWELFEEGRGLCEVLNRDLKMEIRLVWAGGTRILEMIEANRYDVFRRRPKLKWNDKSLMLWRALTWKRGEA
jgi:hydroxysqualene synthase